MMDETFIMNHVKELCSFVSEDPMGDLARAKYVVEAAQPNAALPSPNQNATLTTSTPWPDRADPTAFDLEYVLPDQVNHKLGYTRVRRRSAWQTTSQNKDSLLGGCVTRLQTPKAGTRKADEQVSSRVRINAGLLCPPGQRDPSRATHHERPTMRDPPRSLIVRPATHRS